jgi:aminoglycoside phosphotransferase (APT) family kinase protein
MNNKVLKILDRNGIYPSSVRKLSDDAGRMKDVFQINSSEGRDYGAYIYRQPEGGERGRSIEERIEAEKHIFGKIRSETSLRAPEVIDSGDDFVLCTWIDGDVVGSWEQSDGNINETEKTEVAFRMGEALSEIHNVKYDCFGELGAEGLLRKHDCWSEFVLNLVEMMRGSSDKEIVSRSLDYLEENIRLMKYDPEPVLVHGDFHDGNVLDGERLGVVDCEAGFVGTREYEVDRCLFHWAENWNASEEFIRGYGEENLDENRQQRQSYYRILQSVRGMIDGENLGSSYIVEINEKELKKMLGNI